MQAQPPVTVRVFTQRLSSTRKGARLARLLTLQQLDDWGIPCCCDVSDATALVVAELAANAVRHGHLPGRNFELTLVLATSTLRIEIADARAERLPRTGPELAGGETGRGLLLVSALAAQWGSEPRPHVGKTVWAELDTSACTTL
jgi:two-component sensor histidine kinase